MNDRFMFLTASNDYKYANDFRYFRYRSFQNKKLQNTTLIRQLIISQSLVTNQCYHRTITTTFVIIQGVSKNYKVDSQRDS